MDKKEKKGMAKFKDYEIDIRLKSKVVTWTEYQEKIKQLAEKVDDKYDIVLGIFQGGYIVALSLADYLFKSEIGGVIANTDGVILTSTTKFDGDGIIGKRILVVDEVVESGNSIKKCKEILENKNVARIDTACIYCSVDSSDKIDYYVDTFNKDINYIFPWRNIRDCASLLVDVMEKGKTYCENELVFLIKNVYGIEIKQNDISDMLMSKKDYFAQVEGKWSIK